MPNDVQPVTSSTDIPERYEPRFEPLVLTSCRAISEMDDLQLEAYIAKYQELVGEAEQALESRAGKLGAAKTERRERARIKAAKAPRPRREPAPASDKKRKPKIDLAQAVEQLTPKALASRADPTQSRDGVAVTGAGGEKVPAPPTKPPKPVVQVSALDAWLRKNGER